MSNTQVGNIYQAVIEDVITASRADFEDMGIEESVLQDLRKGWQDKLSALRVAEFPWDPKPEPPPTPAPAAQQASQQQAQQATSSQPPVSQTQHAQAQFAPVPQPQGGLLQAGVNGAGVLIKQEGSAKPDIGVKTEPMDTEPRVKLEQHHVPGNVKARVIENLQNKFGEGASNTIASIRQGQHQPSLTYQQRMQVSLQQGIQQVQAQAQAQARNSMGNHQTDGANDSEDLVGIVTRGKREIGRVEVDQILHAQMLAAQRNMQGEEIMSPLKPTSRRARKPAVSISTATSPTDPILQPSNPSISQNVDGAMDEDEADDDAINSDLDDSADEKDSDDEDEEGGNIMLCVYDKVQRVKNKWKCTLKDGVLTANGREYVFHKAQGEFEW